MPENPENLIAIQNHNLRFRLSDALYAKYVSSLNTRDESSVSLSQDSIFPTIKPDFRTPVLRHRDVHVYFSISYIPHGWRALLDLAANGIFEACIGLDETSGHEHVCMDRDRFWYCGKGGFLVCGGSTGPSR